MSEPVYLQKPSLAWEDAYLEFHKEWLASGEDWVPWVISKDPSDFPALVRFLNDHASGRNLSQNWVPSSTYWLITANGSMVGAVNIRHRLTDFLFNRGGHIGYGIRPSARRKGYATRLLALALDVVRRLEIDQALVVCDATNEASERTILKNGGVPDTDFIEENGNIVKRFWIRL